MWGKKRTVAGFYDGRPNQVLSRSGGEVDHATEGLVWLGSLTMMGHFLGELAFVANDTVVTFDLSFDSDRAAATAEVVTLMRQSGNATRAAEKSTRIWRSNFGRPKKRQR